MLKTSIDEITLVLQATNKAKLKIKSPLQWMREAELIIIDFAYKAKLKKIFGNQQVEPNCPKGYVTGYKFGDHSFYFCVAYNPKNLAMGVCVKFSAQSFAYYLEKSGLEAYSFLQEIGSKRYSYRLSRCDVDVDFMNEKFTPTDIYNKIRDDKTLIYYQKEVNNEKILVVKKPKLQGFAFGKEVPSCYLGAVSSDCRLKIYDKLRDQIEKNGSKLDYFLQFDGVTRFELSLKHELAHNFTNELLDVKDDKQLNDLILATMLQKFYFKDAKSNKEELYTSLMQQALKSNDYYLLGHINQDNDLLKRFEYLLKNSGTVSTLYKIMTIWNDDDLDEAIEYIKNYVKDWKANDNCRIWLKNHTSDTKKTFKSFHDLRQKIS